MENVRAIAFTEQDVDRLIDNFESKNEGKYCCVKYGNSVMIEIYSTPEMDNQENILYQLDFTEFLEQLYPLWNINFDNSIAIYDNYFSWRNDIAVMILKGINYRTQR